MIKIREIIKEFIPPIILSKYRSSKSVSIRITKNEIWSGSFNSWEEAKSVSSGYESVNILERCKTALLKVKNEEVAYERDGVVFDEIEYSWGLLAGLQKVALENEGHLCVLDFGGSLGTSYYQNKEFLNSLNELKWCIVEQPHFVDCGKENFESDQLQFYNTIEECLTYNTPNVLILSGVLQYLQMPFKWIDNFLSFSFPYILIDRTAFVDASSDIITIHHVPEHIYSASYPHYFFNKPHFLNYFVQAGYYQISHFSNPADSSSNLANGDFIFWEGVLLKKNTNDRKNTS